jgi:15-cis-phytoene synthase
MTSTARPEAGTERLPGEAAVMPLAAHENFPVALRFLDRRTRGHLLAIYGFARLVDQIGDEVEGDRRALLDAFEADLDRVFDGEPEHPLLRRLQPTVRDCGMPRGPFVRLIDANRRDQDVTAYATFEELAGYCDLSANPVGELVLHVFGAATPDRIALSDRICTGLQLVEHWQDVAQDFRNGRIYLPAEDLARFGVEPADLGAAHASAAVRELLAFEVDRARRLIDEGAPLVGTLRGQARVAVAGYVGGGLANADAIAAAGYDVLGGPPKAGNARRAAAAARTLVAPPARPEHAEVRRIARASGSSFYAGMRLLPPARRDALFAVYALARRIDDVADGDLPDGEKLAALAAIRAGLARLDEPDDLVLAAVAGAARRYPIPLDAFGDLVTGAEVDVRGTSYGTFDELVVYCRCVAGSIGRLALGVFDCSDRDRADGLADDLGVALQLGNILRDLGEDLPAGRVYLPREDLERFGCEVRDGRLAGPAELLVAFAAQRGLEWLARGLELVPLIDRRSATCVLAMTGKYERLLRRIAADPSVVLEGRPSLAPWEKGLVLARAVTGAAR